jgi:hypothetical protein
MMEVDMDVVSHRRISALARWRLIRYLDCPQATLATLVDYLKVADRTAVKASAPLEGGAQDAGSTCGVVSGGCLSLALANIEDILSAKPGKGEALYRRMREYTEWFEGEFGSNLCRERCGVDLSKFSGFMNYLLTGKVFSRCVYHIGKAASRLAIMVELPLEEAKIVSDLDRKLASEGGYCAAEVMRGIREATDHGSLFLEQISVALDGGIGLSGGLCGALAGALLPLGLIWGIDPRSAGIMRTAAAYVKGHANLHLNRREPEIWTVANQVARNFKREFGSLECKDIIGRGFSSGEELQEFMAGSEKCAEIKRWCLEKCTDQISYYTGFNS